MEQQQIIIRAQDVHYDYEEGDRALDGVTLSIQAGQFVAIIGHNGSGKSTFAKHLNALFAPKSGKVLVLGMDTSQEENLLAVRSHAGMVFQNPDNQMVTTIVEEDVAFGPENLGVPPQEIRRRVDDALQTVGMSSYARHAPHNLSGGQKQRIAIAGVLAMEPDIIVLDESTAMLDPQGREEVLALVHRLNRERGMTVICITHRMEEVTQADQVFVIDHGKVAMQGSPEEIFQQGQALHQLGLEPPFAILLAEALNAQGWALPLCADEGALSDAIAAQLPRPNGQESR